MSVFSHKVQLKVVNRHAEFISDFIPN